MGLLARSTHAAICPPSGAITQQIIVTGNLEVELDPQGVLEVELQARSNLDVVVPAIACGPDPGVFSIAGITGPTTPVEIGTIVASPTIGMSYNNGPPTSASISDNDGNPSTPMVSPFLSVVHPYNFQKMAPDQVVFQGDATDGVDPDSTNRTLVFQSRHFVFWTINPGPYTEANVLAGNQLTAALTGNAAFSLTINPTNPPGGAYLVHVFIDSLGPRVPTQYIIGTSGFPGGMSEVQTGLVMSIPNGTMLCRVMRSNLLQEAPGGVPFQGLA